MNYAKRCLVMMMLAGLPLVFAAGAAVDFSGSWKMNAALGSNLGMMSAMQIGVVITQKAGQLAISETTSFNGSPGSREIHYDLSGKPVTNPGAMGGSSETVAHWDGTKLVVVWTSEGAVAGTKVMRTETRELSADGKRMSVTTVRGTNAPVTMVFEKAP
jgi:hypothetical protein